MEHKDLYKKHIKHKKKNHQTEVDKPNKSHKSFEEALSDFFSRRQVFVLGSYTRPGCEGHPKALKEDVINFFVISDCIPIDAVIYHEVKHCEMDVGRKGSLLNCLKGLKFRIFTSVKHREMIEHAIVIRGTPNHEVGLVAEYQYLIEKFGRRSLDWKLEGQALLEYNGRPYDELRIKLSDGTKKTIIFDVAEFFGKWRR